MATLPPTLPIALVSPRAKAANNCSSRWSRWLRLATSTSSPRARRALKRTGWRSPARFSHQASLAPPLRLAITPSHSSSISGSSTTPSTGSPRCTSARCTAYSPVPCKKSLVPSRGSRIHSHSAARGSPGVSCSLAVSSLSTVQAAAGKAPARPSRSQRFTARSAALTGPSPPSSTLRARAKP